MIKGSCHCGNVQLSIPELTETATSCNCSICSRYGAIWGYFTLANVDITIGINGINSYCHGDKQIIFHSCNLCGCTTHYSSTSPSPDSRLAVNYRMFKAFFSSSTRIRLFDGADTWQFISDEINLNKI